MTATKPTRAAQGAVSVQVAVSLGQAGIPVGQLSYVKQNAREHTSFVYETTWLNDTGRFEISPDLPLTPDRRFRKAPTKADSPFPFALADTEPDAWGRRVIMRAHAKRRKKDATLAALNALDFLLAVDDFSRLGALRLHNGKGSYYQTIEEGRRKTPPIVELEKMYVATRAVEKGEESEQDLKYLMGKGTSLGGMRPKCTLLDIDGTLALGKFPSVTDERDVTRGEVLALKLAKAASITTAEARIVELDSTPVAVITRFDRGVKNGRIPYLSASSMLQASRHDEHSYFEIVDAIRARGVRPVEDIVELWRRLVFNLLITNTDDHLNNLGFLHVADGLWRLAPAFDVNPFPDRDRESRTWLSEETGPITDVDMLLDHAQYFGLTNEAARAILGEVRQAVRNWRAVALGPEVGMSHRQLAAFAPAFEHDQT
ncbi:type II toxin-antitoxin system HipA family toxin [Paraburkholderia sp.]|uniref:type II toxin-antitoxin system HipA family toxin n=1 Tax=Paraburkholderia sp. TaxID=1926495 RepID=UPI00238BEB64|nr:type II toxin-antitoxin system HipA family toxin [Paraburkholderia sp.]MDE1180330.1 type II toxin-antitoxin system HipA family toxin [Paraburkholderia sp.]